MQWISYTYTYKFPPSWASLPPSPLSHPSRSSRSSKLSSLWLQQLPTSYCTVVIIGHCYSVSLSLHLLPSRVQTWRMEPEIGCSLVCCPGWDFRLRSEKHPQGECSTLGITILGGSYPSVSGGTGVRAHCPGKVAPAAWWTQPCWVLESSEISEAPWAESRWGTREKEEGGVEGKGYICRDSGVWDVWLNGLILECQFIQELLDESEQRRQGCRGVSG